MIDALRRLDKKFLLLIICILLLPIIILVILATMQESTISYDEYEIKMKEAVEEYLDEENILLEKEGAFLKVSLEDLVEKKYIKSTDKKLNDDSCTGSVTVRRNGASVKSTEGGYLNYIVDLKCDDYKTTHLIEKIKKDLVTEESGLYQVDNYYIYKGKTPNNFIIYNDTHYRIMSIDENNLLKLVKVYSEKSPRLWDDKFNVETNSYSGKNTYKDSNIITVLSDLYQDETEFDATAKTKIVAHNACIGKRDRNDYSISKELDCSEVIENQMISLFNISDFALASLDPNCNSLNSLSCGNYNYLQDSISFTWTLNSVSNNSYDVLYLSDGLMEAKNAKHRETFNTVIYIDGNEIYKEGEGTEYNPYIIY